MDKEFSNINTLAVLKAMNQYIKIYTPISVPTYIDKKHNQRTAGDKKFLTHSELTYVGSAEQSFIQLMSEGEIQHGTYFAITPCHRDEILDETHLEVFLKIELIAIGADIKNILLYDAMDVFTFLNPRGHFEIVNSGNREGEKDILMNGIEIGSYGTSRTPDGTIYTYGTGLAEPRFSYAVSKG